MYRVSNMKSHVMTKGYCSQNFVDVLYIPVAPNDRVGSWDTEQRPAKPVLVTTGIVMVRVTSRAVTAVCDFAQAPSLRGRGATDAKQCPSLRQVNFCSSELQADCRRKRLRSGVKNCNCWHAMPWAPLEFNSCFNGKCYFYLQGAIAC
jgi:hypothetical protein